MCYRFCFYTPTLHHQANTNSKFIQKTKKGALPHTGSISTHYLLNESYLYPSNQNRILSSLDQALAIFIGHFTKWSSCNKYLTIFSRVKKAPSVFQFGLVESARTQLLQLCPIKGRCVPLPESLYPLFLALAVSIHTFWKYEHTMGEVQLLREPIFWHWIGKFHKHFWDHEQKCAPTPICPK